MGGRKGFTVEKLIVGTLSQHLQLPESICLLLQDQYGELERKDGPFPFNYTHYYDAEMGGDLQKHFLTFRRLVDPSTLPDIKLFTNRIEQQYAAPDGRRTVNLDPGLLSTGRFILATTKDRGHRIPLTSGIFGEVTLIYSSRQFQPLPWTYDDFAGDSYRELLKEIRRSYLDQLKSER